MAFDQQKRHQWDHGSQREKDQGSAGCHPRRTAKLVRVEPQLLARHRVESESWVRTDHVVGQFGRHPRWDALPLVDAAQLGDLRVWRCGKLAGLDAELVGEELACALDRKVFAQGHRQRSGDEARETGDDDGLVRSARSRNAHHQAEVRDEAVRGPKNARTKGVAVSSSTRLRNRSWSPLLRAAVLNDRPGPEPSVRLDCLVISGSINDVCAALTTHWLTQETNATARALYDTLADRPGFIQYRHLV